MVCNGIERRLKKIVLERDNNVCQNCGFKERLHIHHIKPKGRKGKDSINNLITLCNKCHFKAHNFLSYGIWINHFNKLVLLKKPQNLDKYI